MKTKLNLISKRLKVPSCLSNFKKSWRENFIKPLGENIRWRPILAKLQTLNQRFYKNLPSSESEFSEIFYSSCESSFSSRTSEKRHFWIFNMIICRSSRSDVFRRKDVLKPATLLKKRLWHRCFPVNFAKFLRKPFLKEHLRWLFLHMLLVWH